MSRKDYSARARGIPKNLRNLKEKNKPIEKSPERIRVILAQLRKEEAKEGYATSNESVTHISGKHSDGIGVLISERLLGDSQLARIIGLYSNNFQRLAGNALYGWIRQGISEGDYLLLAEEDSDSRGRVMRFALVGKKERVMKDMLISIGKEIGMRLLDGARSLAGDAADSYKKTYKKCMRKSDKPILRDAGYF